MDHVKDYLAKYPLYESLSQRLKILLKDVADAANIDLHAIEARAKTPDSFASKITRPGKDYSDPLSEITDLCGIRAILYYQEDVDQLANAIKKHFDVSTTDSVDKKSELNQDQFGYISLHLICEINKARAMLPEWEIYKGLKFEIQARTVLQHAWASISHQLHYKSNADDKDNFTRQLSRIAGLLELSDEQFSELKKKRATIKTSVKQSIAKKDLDVSINSVSIEQFLSSSKVLRDIGSAVRKAKFKLTERQLDPSHMFLFCQGLQITTLQELNSLLEKFAPRAIEFFNEFAKLSDPTSTLGGYGHWGAVAIVSILRNEKDLKFILDEEIWSADYLEKVKSAADKISL